MELNLLQRNSQIEKSNTLYTPEIKILEKKLELLNELLEDKNLIFRLLDIEDINKSYFELISELTDSPLPIFDN